MIAVLQAEPVTLDKFTGDILVNLTAPCKIRVLGFSEDKAPKEYFLKVTERKGLVLV